MDEDNGKKPRAARRGDWKTEPMPGRHETFVLDRSFSEAEMAVLRCGHVPQAMEDKWFWYAEDIASLNKLLDWWTESPYDHYDEWLSETYDTLKKAGKV